YKSNITFIAQLMGVSWGALAGSFLAPLLYGLYWKKTTRLACWCSYIFGTGIMILNMLFRETFPQIIQSPINAGAFAMLAGIIIVPAVSLISPKLDAKLVSNCFSCYEKEVKVPAKLSLGEDEE
ncbi:MAG: sodium:solute symporter, partial [Lentihominibacter sp.]